MRGAPHARATRLPRDSARAAGLKTVSFGAEESADARLVDCVCEAEFSAVTASDKSLAPILEETGGGAFWMGRAEGEGGDLPRLAMIRSGHVLHGTDWLGLHKRDAYHVKGVRLFPLFSGFLALALLLGLLAMAWYREGR